MLSPTLAAPSRLFFFKTEEEGKKILLGNTLAA